MKALLAAPANLAPIPLVSRTATFMSRVVNRRDVTRQLAMHESVSTLHAIVSQISNAVGMNRWCLYRLPRSGDPGGRVEITKPHPIKNLLERPNPFSTRMQFMTAGEQHLELAGEADLVIGRPAGLSIPTELWLARPDRMSPVPDPQAFLKGWVYTSPDGVQVPLDIDEVVQIKFPNPMDPYRGLSPVPAAMIDLEAWELAAAWNLNFFHNSAQPGGMISVPNRLKDDEFNEMRDRWREQHQGVQNAHRVAILENATWVDRSYSPRDMEFVAMRGLSSEIIREAFAFPKPMLGGTEDVNKAAAWAAQTIFARWIVRQRLEMWREAWNTVIIPMFGTLGDRMHVDFENPIPEDREDDDRERTSKSTAVSQLVGAGFYGPDVLIAYDLPAIRLTTDVVPPAPEPAVDPDQGTEPDPEDPNEANEPPERDPADGDDGQDDGTEE